MKERLIIVHVQYIMQQSLYMKCTECTDDVQVHVHVYIVPTCTNHAHVHVQVQMLPS